MFTNTDIDASRLAFAKKVGATHTLQIQTGQTPEEVGLEVAEVLGGAPDRTIECSGAQFSVDLGVHVSTIETFIDV